MAIAGPSVRIVIRAELLIPSAYMHAKFTLQATHTCMPNVDVLAVCSDKIMASEPGAGEAGELSISGSVVPLYTFRAF